MSSIKHIMALKTLFIKQNLGLKLILLHGLKHVSLDKISYLSKQCTKN